MRILAVGFALLVVAACGGKHNGNADGNGNNGDGSGSGNGDAGPGSGPLQCAAADDACSVGLDCCTGACVGGKCSAAQCTADGADCTTDGECCGGKCDGTCAALNPTCKSFGNPCTLAGDCCSGLCNAAGTCGESSFCVQNGDACSDDGQCCGGICNIGAGNIGTCSQPMPGATNCQAGIDGTLCSTCADCCSALCAIYAPTGAQICQPAEGCRVDGDTCRQDSDCCGAAGTGLPGAGNVTCLKEHADDPVGICRNPTGCDPEGDTCHFKDYTCGNSSQRNDCCDGQGNSGTCKLDVNGVPRCFGLGSGCVATGGACAFSTDCCDGTPCVPDGSGALHCGAACVDKGGQCTNSTDCCVGTSCVFQPGSSFGTCGGSNTCSDYGQACSDTQLCCDTGQPCVVNDGTGNVCPSGGSDCICSTPILQ